jgi:hypothetical protein
VARFLFQPEIQKASGAFYLTAYQLKGSNLSIITGLMRFRCAASLSNLLDLVLLRSMVCLGLIVTTQCGAEVFTFVTAAGLPGSGPPLDLTGDGTNSMARFASPAGLSLDSANTVYLADASAIRRLAATGTNWVVTTLAGVIGQHGPEDGTNANARFDSPQGVNVDIAGNVYVADTLNNAIRKVTAYGTNWSVTTIAGITGRTSTGSADGTNSSARFDHPYGIAADQVGNLYVADSFNSTIRKISPIGQNWVVTTLAGSPGNHGSADGMNSAARFDGPTSLVSEGGTNLYITDFNNHTIRGMSLIGTNWIVRTLAGVADLPGALDGTNSVARFFQPQGICRDAFGSLYVSDSGNHTIRKLKRFGTNWVVATVAGASGLSGAANGTGSGALFSGPYGLGFDAANRLFVADAGNQTIRLGQVAVMLDFKAVGSQLTLGWPIAATNYSLETATNLANGSWSSVNGAVLTGDTYSFQTNTGGGRGYFRLHKP